MRTFAISDIHGNNELFRRALKQVGLKKSDRLILLGDLIDRGQDSKEVLDTIFLLIENGFKLDMLFGNHEQMFLDAFENTNNLTHWLINGGDKTLISFLTSSISKIPLKYIDLIRSFKYSLEVDNFIFVHATLNMTIGNPFDDKQTILWERNPYKYFNPDWLNSRIIVHGHNPISQDGIIESISNNESLISIDNGTYQSKPKFGSLCIFQLENKNVRFIQ